VEQYVATARHIKQSLYLFVLPFCDADIFIYEKNFLTLITSPKRKQALLKSNLPAIRLVHIR